MLEEIVGILITYYWTEICSETKGPVREGRYSFLKLTWGAGGWGDNEQQLCKPVKIVEKWKQENNKYTNIKITTHEVRWKRKHEVC